MKIGAYIGRHWRGEVTLRWAFWVNFVALFSGWHLVQPFLLPPYLEPQRSMLGFGFLAAFCVVVYPWQVVGVIRAAEVYAQNASSGWGGVWSNASRAVVVLSLVAVLGTLFAAYQASIKPKPHPALRVPPPTENYYQLTLSADRSSLGLRGWLEIGVTEDVAKHLRGQPQIRDLELDSEGGRISAARGLARLIQTHQLNTHSRGRCFSACTIAFIAGKKRTLYNDAQLGFHQYRSYTVLPVFDIAAEQAKDRELFLARGIGADFLRKMFLQPPENMWIPRTDELLASGVIHAHLFD